MSPSTTPVALLNPGSDALLARRLVAMARARLAALDLVLIGSAVDRELYLKTIGARLELHQLIVEMQRLYDKETAA